MKKWTRILLFGLILFSLSLNLPPKSAPAEDPYFVVAAVNAFRTSQGLPALQINSALMAAAQAHSDYQASIQTVTHTGTGGSRPVDRAEAFGFGNGAQIFVSENIAGGMSMTINTAIYQYWQDSLHLNTMLNPAALFIGAGVADADGYVYITIVTGYWVGVPGSTAGDNSGTSFESSGPIETPFVKSTPRDDGAVVHIVEAGQSLIGIANSYEVTVAEVLIFNQMTLDTIIYPGDEIILRLVYTPTATTPATSPEPSSTPNFSQTPTHTPTLLQVTFDIPNTSTPSITPSPTPLVISPESEPMVVGIVLFALVAFLSVIIGGLFKRSDNTQ